MKKAALIIMDGWGIGDGSESDTVDRANTPFIDSLYKNNPNATLKTFGAHVGLPDGQLEIRKLVTSTLVQVELFTKI